jgi:hypothetical protein
MSSLKLIWQEISPAPFESAWSVFGKILLLNALRSNQLIALIAKESSRHLKKLDHLNPDWIDFNKFSDLLGVDKKRIMQCFPTSLGINTEIALGRGIKFCPKCLELGYQSVFFNFEFITTCPWHEADLEQCMECELTIISKAFRTSSLLLEGEQWITRFSKCNHIRLDDRYIQKLNRLSDSELLEIKSKNEQMFEWLNKLKVQPHLVDELYQASRYHHNNKEILTYMVSLAENIAGTCPWKIKLESFPVRIVSWNLDFSGVDQDSTIASEEHYSSDYGKVFRSIKNHIFNRYVRTHRRCWKRLKHYDVNSALHINSDTMCNRAIAYGIWVLLNSENLQFRSLLKSPRSEQKIRVLRSFDRFKSEDDDRISIERFAKTLYAHFFLIWKIIVVEKRIYIYVSTNCFGHEDYYPYLVNDREGFITFADPVYLASESNKVCKRMSKDRFFMVLNWVSINWFDSMIERRALDNRIVLKLDKEPLLPGRSTHRYYGF